MKLDFPFDSDLSHLTDDKSNIPRSIHQVLGQNSTAELNQKIASVKKVTIFFYYEVIYGHGLIPE